MMRRGIKPDGMATSIRQLLALASASMWFLGLFSPTLRAQTWDIEVVENGKRFAYMTDRSLRIDEQGRRHIAYGYENLYYCWYDGVDWHYETADSSQDVGRHAAIALDTGGDPHISYYDFANGDLKYTYRSSRSWHTQTIDSQGNVGSYTSVDLDVAGYPHISYYDETYGDLKYAYADPSGWHVLTVDSQGNVGSYSSLVLDGSGYPHVSYHGGGLKYAFEDAMGWHFQIVDTVAVVRWQTSLALDSSGHPHISYYRYHDGTNGDLMYAHRDSSGWRIETADTAGDVGYYTSLAISDDGHPHISYSDHTYCLKYCNKDEVGWHVMIVDAGPLVGGFTSLALDPTGYPQISHLDWGPDPWYGNLKYAYADASGWHAQIADWGRPVGESTSLAVDAARLPRIAYGGSCALKYACEDAEGWQLQAVDSKGSTAAYASLALDSTGHPHIAYCDDENGDLKYAYEDGAGWHVELIDSIGYVGMYASIALDSWGYPHICYLDSVAVNLARVKYAYADAEGWRLATVTTINGTCWDIALALDGSDFPHIIYSSGPSLFEEGAYLWYLYEDGSGWHEEGVCYGVSCSLTLDQQGRPHMSLGQTEYVDYYQTGYAFRDDAGWHVTTIGSMCWTPVNSLALDSLGGPHVALTQAYDLDYVHKHGSEWTVHTVDSTIWEFRWISLALDTRGTPHIGYHDYRHNDLKYAQMVEPQLFELHGVLTGDTLQLTWNTVTGTQYYWIYGATNLPFFEPGFAQGYDFRLVVLPSGTTTWSSPNGIADPDNNWTYLVMAVDEVEAELARSNRVGEHDFEAEIP